MAVDPAFGNRSIINLLEKKDNLSIDRQGRYSLQRAVPVPMNDQSVFISWCYDASSPMSRTQTPLTRADLHLVEEGRQRFVHGVFWRCIAPKHSRKIGAKPAIRGLVPPCFSNRLVASGPTGVTVFLSSKLCWCHRRPAGPSMTDLPFSFELLG